MDIFKKTHYLLLTALVAFGLIFTGCDLLGGDDDEEETAVANVAPGITAFAVVKDANNEIDPDSVISFEGIIEDSDGKVKTVNISVTDTAGTTADLGDVSPDSAIYNLSAYTANVPNSLKPGELTFTLTATDDKDTVTTATATATLQKGGTPVSTKQVELGSWQSSLGSSLDADDMTVYTSGAAKTNSSKIDIIYSNEAPDSGQTIGANALYSPKQASLIKLVGSDTWATKNETKMKIITGVDFDAIKTQEEIVALWTPIAAGDKKQLVRPSAGDIVILKTQDGSKVVLIKFISGDGIGTGKAVIKGTL
ncbi:MAG: hypothetical protein HQK83_12440 [Fibrobacteria bacterium]|nr:hypothetical protein [Fibrobacteria bacterium]